MEGFTTYDSRVDSSMFDLQSLTFQPSNDLDTNQSIRWFVQPVNNSMLGPRSTSSVFHIPHDIGQEINSTWGYLNISEGGFLPSLNEPSGFIQDIGLDSGSPNYDLSGDSVLSIGRSSFTTSTSARSSVLFSIDISKLPLGNSVEVMSAELYLTTESGSYGEVWASQSKVLTSFDGNANWNNATSLTTWNAPGAYHSSDTSVPMNGAGLIDSDDSSVFGNITEVIQQVLV
jgi:hypothetical protein